MSHTRVIVVLTALDLEYESVHHHLSDVTSHRHQTGTRFEVGLVAGSRCRIALGLTGPGNHPSGILMERAIQEFDPEAVMFVGVAGALWTSTALGDVVVPSHVYAYHGGTSEDDGRKARPRVWETSHDIVQLAHELGRSGDWAKRLPDVSETPKVHFKPIAAGELVQNSRISDDARWIRDIYNDAAAIEMEAAGVAQAGHLNRTRVAIVRGISDMADGTKGTDNDRDWQPRAAANAAAFAVRLAEELVNERQNQDMVSKRSNSEADSGGNVYNLSSGTVGIQAGQVHGSTVWMNTPSPGETTAEDVMTAIVGLREHLDTDRANKEIDADSYEAAVQEIDTAESCMHGSDDGGRKRSLLALKRLSGLVVGTTTAAASVATLIAAVSRLS